MATLCVRFDRTEHCLYRLELRLAFGRVAEEQWKQGKEIRDLEIVNLPMAVISVESEFEFRVPRYCFRTARSTATKRCALCEEHPLMSEDNSKFLESLKAAGINISAVDDWALTRDGGRPSEIIKCEILNGKPLVVWRGYPFPEWSLPGIHADIELLDICNQHDPRLSLGKYATPAIRNIVAQYNSVNQRHSAAVTTLQRYNQNEPFILYLRDFALGVQKGVRETQEGKKEPIVRSDLAYSDKAVEPLVKFYCSASEINYISAMSTDNYIISNTIVLNAPELFGFMAEGKIRLEDWPARSCPQTPALRLHGFNWQEAIANLISAAHGIVFYLGNLSGGTQLEIQLIREFGLQDRTVVLLGPGITKPRVSQELIRSLLPDFVRIYDVYECIAVDPTCSPVGGLIDFTSDIKEDIKRLSSLPHLESRPILDVGRVIRLVGNSAIVTGRDFEIHDSTFQFDPLSDGYFFPNMLAPLVECKLSVFEYLSDVIIARGLQNNAPGASPQATIELMSHYLRMISAGSKLGRQDWMVSAALAVAALNRSIGGETSVTDDILEMAKILCDHSNAKHLSSLVAEYG